MSRAERPMTPVAFEILLALAEGDRHGYAVMAEVDRRSKGQIKLHPGTLYRALGRLMESGHIEEIEERPDPAIDDQRRRYYRLTDEGRNAARQEAERLAQQVERARLRNLLGGVKP